LATFGLNLHMLYDFVHASPSRGVW